MKKAGLIQLYRGNLARMGLARHSGVLWGYRNTLDHSGSVLGTSYMVIGGDLDIAHVMFSL